MNAARNAQRYQCRSNRIKQLICTKKAAKSKPDPGYRANDDADKREKNERPAHRLFFPVHLRNRDSRIHRKRYKNTADYAFHLVFTSFIGNKIPQTLS